MFENTTHNWNKIYLSPCLATMFNTTLRSFEYKILNNVLLFNKKLYTFGITNTAICSFCKRNSNAHFLYFIHLKCLCERLQMQFQNNLILPTLTPQTVILGLYNESNDNYNLLSHILLIFKYYIYISREKRTLKRDIITANLIKIKKKEK